MTVFFIAIGVCNLEVTELYQYLGVCITLKKTFLSDWSMSHYALFQMSLLDNLESVFILPEKSATDVGDKDDNLEPLEFDKLFETTAELQLTTEQQVSDLLDLQGIFSMLVFPHSLTDTIKKIIPPMFLGPIMPSPFELYQYPT